jgi:hypothetical protein
MKAVPVVMVCCMRDLSSLLDCSLSFQSARRHFPATKFT